MKKIMLSLAMALVSVCASAQVYIGGTAGISSNKFEGGDSKTAYALMPKSVTNSTTSGRLVSRSVSRRAMFANFLQYQKQQHSL